MTKRSCGSESKTVSRPCLENLSISIDFSHHSTQGMVTGVVSRKINSLGASTIDRSNCSAQVLVGNPLPWGLACADHRLELHPSAVASPASHREVKSATNVYAKPPFGSPEQVLKYLASYTHRVAISNRRLLSLRDGKVTFRYKDYNQQGRKRIVTVEAAEFIRRFLLHVLPKGFMRIRHYGLLANRGRKENLALCRSCLGTAQIDSEDCDNVEPENIKEQEEDDSKPICPLCGKGHMIRVDTIAQQPKNYKEIPCYLMFDTS